VRKRGDRRCKKDMQRASPIKEGRELQDSGALELISAISPDLFSFSQIQLCFVARMFSSVSRARMRLNARSLASDLPFLSPFKSSIDFAYIQIRRL
jgi:hypothetical protein